VSAAFPIAASLVLAMTDREPMARPTAPDLMGVMPELLVEMQRPVGGEIPPAQMPQAQEPAEPEGRPQARSAPQAEGRHERQMFEFDSRPGDTRECGHGPGDLPRTEEQSAEVKKIAAPVKGVQEVEQECLSCEPENSKRLTMQEPSASSRPPDGVLTDSGVLTKDSGLCDALALAARKFLILLVLFGLDRLPGLGGATCYEGTAEFDLKTTLALGMGLRPDPHPGLCAAPDMDPLLYGSQLLRLLALMCATITLANVCPMRMMAPAAEEEAGHGGANLQGVLGSLLP